MTLNVNLTPELEAMVRDKVVQLTLKATETEIQFFRETGHAETALFASRRRDKFLW